jgi:para-aminobenzoate synthetase component 1
MAGRAGRRQDSHYQMRAQLYEIETALSPEALAGRLRGEPGLVLLRSTGGGGEQARYSFLACRPFLTFRSTGSACELYDPVARSSVRQFGDPWTVLEALMSRYESLDQADLPFPLGGCFGYWGYDLKNFLEPKLTRRAGPRIEMPDCLAGFYDSLVAFDHTLGRAWVISTGLARDGSRSKARAMVATRFWQSVVAEAEIAEDLPAPTPHGRGRRLEEAIQAVMNQRKCAPARPVPTSDMSRADFISAARRAQEYIRFGHIYQVNLSHALSCGCGMGPWELFEALSMVSPAPFAAFLDGGDFQVVSASPERFLRISGRRIETRPIKGTRPRSADPFRDAQLSFELQTSPKEAAELVMITDLLRNDLGKICEYGTVQTPELMRLERFAQVQHLVSTVTGQLREGTSHVSALAACFPGGSITGAPKFRAMEIIDELEQYRRGAYTGCLGYLGFNGETQLNILIRTAVVKDRAAVFQVGAGIVADSDPEAEYAETLVKAQGFLSAMGLPVAEEYPAAARRIPV